MVVGDSRVRTGTSAPVPVLSASVCLYPSFQHCSSSYQPLPRMSSLISVVRNSASTHSFNSWDPHTLPPPTEFLDAIRSVNPPSRWKILVIDEHSQQLLNSVLKQFDILEENVTRALPSPLAVLITILFH
jgi:hypothetical protein